MQNEHPMDCQGFEERMGEYFASTDTEVIKSALFGANADAASLPSSCSEHSKLIHHLERCDDCRCSLLQYVEIRDLVDYHDYPCFHLAYYSNSPTDKCIKNVDGAFTIHIFGSGDESIGIGFCPWCGLEFPTSYADMDEAERLGLPKWRERRAKQRGRGVGSSNKSFNGTPTRALRGSGPVNSNR